ncbi:hypothetical protein GCM10027612_32730 [Microbispora bryophytorum subsp. camponoti]
MRIRSLSGFLGGLRRALRTPATLGRMVLVIAAVALPTVWLSGVGAAAQDQGQQAVQAAEQTLVWTADNSYTQYKSAPTTAKAGLTTIVFETNASTGNTSGLTHTLTFDVSSPGYNHDVNVNFVASPFDASGGRHEVQVNLTPERTASTARSPVTREWSARSWSPAPTRRRRRWRPMSRARRTPMATTWSPPR